MKAKIKNGFAPKVCIRCSREFEWRKKWARDWENGYKQSAIPYLIKEFRDYVYIPSK